MADGGARASDRHSVARDVHDGLAQELAFIANRAQQLAPTGADATIVTQIQSAAQRALLEARVTIEVLRAPEDAPLDVLVERAVTSFQARFEVPVDLDLTPGLTIDAPRSAALLRILGQAMANAVQHGGAMRMSVRLRARADGVSLRIDDDGCGFHVARAGSGWGLRGMRERAELLGGRCAVSSHPGRGTRVEAVLP